MELMKDNKQKYLTACGWAYDGVLEREYEYGWGESAIVFLRDRTEAYRKKSNQLKVDWDGIDDNWNHAAMDKDGEVCFYTEEPTLEGGVWVNNVGNVSGKMPLKKDGVNWKESLIKRPDKC